MRFETARTISMGDVTAKPEITEAVRDRVREGKCLIEGCDCDANTRGLCEPHYQLFIRAKKSKPRSERADFEAAVIRDGMILAPHQVLKINSTNPFAHIG